MARLVQDFVDDSDMMTALSVMLASGTLSLLEHCELLTLLDRSTSSEARDRLVSIVLRLDRGKLEACRVILRALSDKEDDLLRECIVCKAPV